MQREAHPLRQCEGEERRADSEGHPCEAERRGVVDLLERKVEYHRKRTSAAPHNHLLNCQEHIMRLQQYYPSDSTAGV
ncbi:MAG: hypothetical protein ACQET3_08475 [Promethearchaeati archaeon]